MFDRERSVTGQEQTFGKIRTLTLQGNSRYAIAVGINL
jgi:hypothetical protein